ncbi:MAG: UDP-N-acetylmuramoyl-L-alanyl-D-glutamate--2,6-diaminopimelate ligase [bacterium]|nr:UDP-N-acetylmuramoyl-L-alanyl-D-glutamate--2,6-diaminopimelate ligase [bacterium]
MMKLLRRIIPPQCLSAYHLTLAFLGALLYGFPSRKLTLIGVTGTNGKSTCVEMLSRVLNASGKKTASISSIRFEVGGVEERNRLKMTMPGRLRVQRFLREAVKQGCEYAVLEVTSEGILQHRHRFLGFDVAVFTNLSPEHIERHGSYEKYREAKGSFFSQISGIHVVNMNDKEAEYFLSFPAQEKWGYGIDAAKGEKVVVGRNVQADEKGSSFEVEGVLFRLRLQGRFNVSNALCAIATARSQGVSLKICKQALEGIEKVPGRMEEIASSPFRVVVDYAFTPAALEQVYASLKPKKGKLICVLGAAGGGRDRWKRKVLGTIAQEHCDKVVVTNEDPYEEDPMAIMDEVAQEGAVKILDRREAIRKAISLAQVGDVVVVTGKGSEDSMAVAGGKKIPWDDRDVIREELDAMGKS